MGNYSWITRVAVGDYAQIGQGLVGRYSCGGGSLFVGGFSWLKGGSLCVDNPPALHDGWASMRDPVYLVGNYAWRLVVNQLSD